MVISPFILIHFGAVRHWQCIASCVNGCLVYVDDHFGSTRALLERAALTESLTLTSI